MTNNYDYSEDSGYVNIHGHDVKVYVCNKTGQILVPLDEINKMGFRIYRKSQYNKLLIDDNQFNKEFDLFMLQSAQTYMLQNKILFKEDAILESINKCKMRLSGQNEVKTPFNQSQVMEHSPTDITITTNLRSPNDNILKNIQNDRMFKGFTPNKTPGHVLQSEEKSPENVRNNNEEYSRNYRKFNGKQNNFALKSSPRASTENIKSIEEKPLTKKASFENIAKNFPKKESEEERQKKLETIELSKPEHNVLVSYVEKSNCIWVQDKENADKLLDIHTAVQKNAEIQKITQKYSLNKIYLGPDDGCWYRCKVIKFRPLTVFFVDFGNSTEVNELKEASDELTKIPCQAVRITFPESQYQPQLFQEITIIIRKRFDNGTYSVDIRNNMSTKVFTPLPSVKTFFLKPPTLCKLENGQKVMIISHTGAILALRTRECYDKLIQIEKILENFDPRPIDSVEENQLVLCEKGKLQRAIVCNNDGKFIEVELLDYHEKIKVDLTKIYQINEFLSKEPITFIVTPPIKNYNEEAAGQIEELIMKKAKAVVVLNEGDFDLKIGADLLSDKLKPKPKSNYPTLKDFERSQPPLGVGEYVLQTYRNKSEVYFTSLEILEDYIGNIVLTSIDNDNQPHIPEIGEVCFGLYQGSWSRCVVINHKNDDFSVQFIDFGNIETLHSENLRKLSEDAKKAPIVAWRCQLTDLPTVQNIEALVGEILNENDNYEIDIKSCNGNIYTVAIPALTKAVKAMV